MLQQTSSVSHWCMAYGWAVVQAFVLIMVKTWLTSLNNMKGSWGNLDNCNCDAGDSFRLSLCGLFLLLACGKASKEQGIRDLVGVCVAWLQEWIIVGSLCNKHLLVHYHTYNCRLRRFASSEPRGDDLWHFFHAAKFGTHCIYHWKHDKSYHSCDRPNPRLCEFLIPHKCVLDPIFQLAPLLGELCTFSKFGLFTNDMKLIAKRVIRLEVHQDGVKKTNSLE